VALAGRQVVLGVWCAYERACAVDVCGCGRWWRGVDAGGWVVGVGYAVVGGGGVSAHPGSSIGHETHD